MTPRPGLILQSMTSSETPFEHRPEPQVYVAPRRPRACAPCAAHFVRDRGAGARHGGQSTRFVLSLAPRAQGLKRVLTRSPSRRPSSELKAHYKIDWTPGGEIGKGHFGAVYKGQALRNPPFAVACKRVPRSATRTDALHNEIQALSACQGHPNIVALYDVFFDDLYVMLMLEYLGGGELFARIVNCGAYSERDASVHARGLVSAMAFMHGRGIVHRDLKPENLILAYPPMDSPIKISDFGLSKIVGTDSDTMKTVCGTRAYSAPEVNFGLAQAAYTAKVDVWSLGVILYVILGGYHPFDPFGNSSEADTWARACRGEWDFNDPVWQSVSDNAKYLLSQMICVDPALRLDAAQVLEHPWIANAADLPVHNVSSVAKKSMRQFINSSDGMDVVMDENKTRQTHKYTEPVVHGQRRVVEEESDTSRDVLMV